MSVENCKIFEPEVQTIFFYKFIAPSQSLTDHIRDLVRTIRPNTTLIRILPCAKFRIHPSSGVVFTGQPDGWTSLYGLIDSKCSEMDLYKKT